METKPDLNFLKILGQLSFIASQSEDLGEFIIMQIDNLAKDLEKRINPQVKGKPADLYNLKQYNNGANRRI